MCGNVNRKHYFKRQLFPNVSVLEYKQMENRTQALTYAC